MKIIWNKVTWYSKVSAAIVFICAVLGAFYLGVVYGQALVQTRDVPQSTNLDKGIFADVNTVSNLLVGSWIYRLPEVDCASVTDLETVCFPSDSHEMRFEKKGNIQTMNSYLHSRPEYSGCAWNLVENEIVVSCEDYTETYHVLSLTKETLHVTTGTVDESVLYHRYTEN